ncbi:hypothetical protein HPP92_004146 [Vanilla planifolia]|uniref:Kelch repeat-containing protein n=1 Tax=Vanilla planifolia TaxID=51239 RepID=A0A835S9A9_VANPL|nr:hypothetical protein HPP92_004146 [Vanilla planifolia]
MAERNVAIQLYKKMVLWDIKPRELVTSSLLRACAKLSILNSGEQFHGVAIKLGHQSCLIVGNSLINMYGKCGNMEIVKMGMAEAAAELAYSMPFEPDSAVWTSILSGCRLHSNVKLAEYAANQLFSWDPLDRMPYLHLISIYKTAENLLLIPPADARAQKSQRRSGDGEEEQEAWQREGEDREKTAKAEEKRARRESKKVSEEDDIDAILRSIQKEEAKKKEVHVEENAPSPSPRSNCTLTINPQKETELILYGGEFYNGKKTFVYGDLYRYDVEKSEWKLISSPNSPPPRSAHQAVAWKSNIYIFGGEFTSPNQERFHHYKDFWTLDLKTNQWEQLLFKGCPTARSGHRMVLYKHKIILFGGFYDTLREVRYYNDLHIFDLDTLKWQEIKPTPGCMWPSARSGFQLFIFQDEEF